MTPGDGGAREVGEVAGGAEGGGAEEEGGGGEREEREGGEGTPNSHRVSVISREAAKAGGGGMT